MSLRKEMEATPIVGSLSEPIECAVNHPSWPKQVYVRQLCGSDLRAYEKLLAKVQASSGSTEIEVSATEAWDILTFLACRCLADESNKRLFDNEDQQWIDDNLPGAVIVQVSQIAIEFNGLKETAVMDEQKNSESGPPSDS